MTTVIYNIFIELQLLKVEFSDSDFLQVRGGFLCDHDATVTSIAAHNRTPTDEKRTDSDPAVAKLVDQKACSNFSFASFNVYLLKCGSEIKRCPILHEILGTLGTISSISFYLFDEFTVYTA